MSEEIFKFQSTHPRGVRPRILPLAAVPFTFQSTHPRGVRRPTSCPMSRRKEFQSTHPRGVRHASCFITLTYTDVSIHAPAWGATSFRATSKASSIGFNPRTRVGCDSVIRDSQVRVDKFQSTHPRGVRQPVLVPLHGGHVVSIHAPAWGATVGWGGVVMTERVSIHAPAWGATPGTDLSAVLGLTVSIHAPAWGATRRMMIRLACSVGFQSTHPRGVRLGIPTGIEGLTVFQSTHPRGVRLNAFAFRAYNFIVFQSTHPRGVRLLLLCLSR